MASFDSPQSSSIVKVHATGTIPAHNDAGYIEINVTVTGGRNEVFYRTFAIDASLTRTTPTHWAGNGTYDIVISPRIYGAQTTIATVDCSFKH